MATLKTTALVIGAGTGGYPCAIRLGQLGVDAILVEKDQPGGVCLNWGCIPSKALISATKLAHKAEHADTMGISFGKPQVDMTKMQGWKAGIIKRLTGGVQTLVKGAGTKYIKGTAEFLGPKRVKVRYADGKPDDTIEFEYAVIATGSVPRNIPGFEVDQKRIVDSTGMLDLDHVPEHLVCIGGGIIGLELGQTFQRLGTKLVVLEGLDRILGPVDADLAKIVHRQIEKDGGEIHVKTFAKGWEERDGKAYVKAEIGGKLEEIPADVVLVAVGRVPVTHTVAIEKSGVKVNDHGFIDTDAQMRTNVPHIFAIGDLVPGPMLAHKATHEARVAAEVAAGEKSAFDARTIPSVAYTDPEIAWVGLTETQAKADGTPFEKAKIPWAASGRALSLGRTEGFTKLLFDKDTGRVLGGGIVGPGAGDLIAEVGLAVEMGADAVDLGHTIHPHPTLSETVNFAAEMFEGTITDLMPPKKRK